MVFGPFHWDTLKLKMLLPKHFWIYHIMNSLLTPGSALIHLNSEFQRTFQN